MRLLVLSAVAGAFLALSLPVGSASAAELTGSSLVQADWNGRPDWNDHWHHHWRHEWHDHYRPEWHQDWHSDWHHHWHHREDRPYGYQY
jgi:hypothetical protein